MSNKNDVAVPFTQGIEFFVTLRRMDKKVWLLQYDNGYHEPVGADAEDFNFRMMQFFDHYLKDSLPPKWMTRGIPATRKGVDNGLELDYEIKTPGEGLLMKEETKER